jgi:hypothetical protein
LPEAFARWIADQTGGPPPRFERVEPGDEQILEDREQRDLDGVPLFVALRDADEQILEDRLQRDLDSLPSALDSKDKDD